MNARPNHPDPNATGVPDGLRSDGPETGDGAERPGRTLARETQERDAARRRGRARRRAGDAGHDPEFGRADPALMHEAYRALAENVRDYAVFLLDVDGIIRFWGEGAYLMKRWSKEEAEGSHLRMLYLDGGSEDGTAEDHIIDSAEQGEYVGEGQRVRGDGTTFWARVTLTALKDENGKLIGFSKVTIDLTAQHVADARRTLRWTESEVARLRAERREHDAEIAIMKEEIAVLRRELEARDRER
jgi:PAS domain S-box-containing protein